MIEWFRAEKILNNLRAIAAAHSYSQFYQYSCLGFYLGRPLFISTIINPVLSFVDINLLVWYRVFYFLKYHIDTLPCLVINPVPDKVKYF